MLKFFLSLSFVGTLFHKRLALNLTHLTPRKERRGNGEEDREMREMVGFTFYPATRLTHHINNV